MKPQKVKPSFYAHCYSQLHKIAREMGYNILLHGSLDRDLDLVAVPWIDEPKSHLELLQEFNLYLNGVTCSTTLNTDEDILLRSYCFSILGGGRSSYIINLNRGGKFNGYIDEQYYLDISITPLNSF
jgi:hypothetical protein